MALVYLLAFNLFYIVLSHILSFQHAMDCHLWFVNKIINLRLIHISENYTVLYIREF